MDKNYSDQIIVDKNYVIKKIPVKFSNIDEKNITVMNDVSKYLPNDFDINKVKIEYDGAYSISFLDNNKKIGTIKVSLDDKIIYQEDVIIDGLKINFILLTLILLMITFFILLLFKKLFIHK